MKRALIFTSVAVFHAFWCSVSPRMVVVMVMVVVCVAALVYCAPVPPLVI
jgi:hypothetical protein